MAAAPFVVVGAGQAGLQVCDTLRKLGYDGELVLIGEEAELPYQRPPLSKQFLAGDLEASRLSFRPASYYEKLNIDVRLHTRVTAIDRARQRLELDNGEEIPYQRLALTTGTRVRPLRGPGCDLDDIYYIRTLADSERLRARLASVDSVAVVGGGFIGLEAAAMARKLDKQVCVIEAQERLMARAVSPMVSAFYADLHHAHGVDLKLECGVDAIAPDAGRLAISLSNADTITADIVIAGIGVVANEELAAHSGIVCRNGIVVDVAARTSDPAIVAAGDCTQHYNGFLGREMRLESVQNAVDQAKVAAASMLDQAADYHQVPWFWSDQYDVKLQMAGIGMPYDAYAVRGVVADLAFSIFYFRDDHFVGADSINRPADHMMSRKLLQHGTVLTVEQASDESVDLKQLAQGSEGG